MFSRSISSLFLYPLLPVYLSCARSHLFQLSHHSLLSPLSIFSAHTTLSHSLHFLSSLLFPHSLFSCLSYFPSPLSSFLSSLLFLPSSSIYLYFPIPFSLSLSFSLAPRFLSLHSYFVLHSISTRHDPPFTCGSQFSLTLYIYIYKCIFMYIYMCIYIHIYVANPQSSLPKSRIQHFKKIETRT